MPKIDWVPRTARNHGRPRLLAGAMGTVGVSRT